LSLGDAEQLAACPPFKPEQVHDHGPLPVTALAKPAEHKSLIGIWSVFMPFAPPQRPSVFLEAWHAAAWPPLTPEQAHVHGPLPLTRLDAPLAQRLAAGAISVVMPSALPHCASSYPGAFAGALSEGCVSVVEATDGVGVATTPPAATGAAQLTVIPPPTPWQFHFHGPLPDTGVPRPDTQRS
jgi:hypothetical protein